MSFEAQNSLETLLMQASSDAGVRPDFYRALLGAEVYVLGQVRGKPAFSRFVSGEGTTLALREVRGEGRRIVPFFSSPARIDDYLHRPEPHVALSMGALLDVITPDVELVLNPGSAYSKHFVRAEVAALRDGTIFAQAEARTVREGEALRLSVVDAPPERFVAALRSLFAVHEVRRAYLAHVQQREETPALLMAVQMANEGDFDALVRDCVVIARETLDNGQEVQFVALRARGGGTLEAYFERAQPFYTGEK